MIKTSVPTVKTPNQNYFSKTDGLAWAQLLTLIGLGALLVIVVVLPLRHMRAERALALIKLDLRHFHMAAQAYQSTEASGVYAPAIAGMVKAPSGRRYLDPSWDKPKRHGYYVAYKSGGEDSENRFSLSVSNGYNRVYCIDQNGMISGPGPTDLPVGTRQGCRGGIPVV